MAVLPWTVILLGLLFCLQGNQAYADGEYFFTIFSSFLHIGACSRMTLEIIVCEFSIVIMRLAGLLVLVASMKNSCYSPGT